MVIALVGLWIAYLVPHLFRYRQQLLESRADDRFSDQLRVLRVAQVHPSGADSGRQLAARNGRVLLHRPSGRGGGSVDRPHAATDRAVVVAARHSALARSERAAYLARRGARTRRRRGLAVLLLLATAGAWAGVSLVALPLVVGAAPSALLMLVMVAGRRAVVRGRRIDTAWRAGPQPVAKPPAARGRRELARAARSKTTVAAAAVTDSPEVSPAGTADGWVPVPVPRPAYTLKPAVPRPEPAPLVLDEVPAAAGEAAAADDAAVAVVGELDLDAVLDRRRASGE